MFRIFIRTIKTFHSPPKVICEGFPEKNKLPFMPKTPQYAPGYKIRRMMKNTMEIRGVENVHNQLIHRQYGVQALGGGKLKHGHFEMMRNTINKKLDFYRTFAIYRVEPLWRPETKKGIGKRCGNGKGSIDHYTTPVKRGRIIMEIGGTLEFRELSKVLNEVAHKLPFPARTVTQDLLDEEEKTEEMVREENINPLKWEWIIRNNLMNIHSKISPQDIIFSVHGPNVR
ncbi:hypothetical protein SNEBB_009849 [Seison nebaliae]|nr:hypothetical protein SNEBB_009849 [Seison nebaliae]